MTAGSRAVSEIGEQGLLKLLSTRLSPPPQGDIWSGDDAAVVDPPSGKLVVTTDVIVENVDFRLDTFSPPDVGWKAIGINVSDIAAMGARPRYALATMSLRRDVPVELFEGVADGLFEAARAFGVDVIGGDLSEAVELSVGVTMIGSAECVIRRDGATVGDAICVTGELGGAAGGVIALAEKIDAPALIERQRRPRPRVDEGPALAASGVTAMIDVSDGLAVDLGHLLDASGVGCDVDPTAIPIDPNLSAIDVDTRELALIGGEDFELLFTTPDAGAARAAVSGTQVTQIGVITDGEARIGEQPLSEWRQRAWDHLRTQ